MMTTRSRKYRKPFLFTLSTALCLAMLAATVPQVHAGQEIMVSAAASLTNVMKDIALRFEQKNSDVIVILNFAASGTLLQQIARGAPVDVFAPADPGFMDKAQSRGLIRRDTRQIFAGNSLVLAVPAQSTHSVSMPQDLLRPEVTRIALGLPRTVPAGAYAVQALASYRLLSGLTPKFIYGNSVRQVLDYLRRAEVDAGFIYRTDAVLAAGKVVPVCTIQGHAPIVYTVAVCRNSGAANAAQHFIDFLFSPKALEILQTRGFDSPQATAALSAQDTQ